MLTINGFEKAFEYWQLFFQGVVCTISLSALTVLFGFILALVLSACRMGKSRILKAVSENKSDNVFAGFYILDKVVIIIVYNIVCI